MLAVIYLVFNEGYAATREGPLMRTDLCTEAIRLGRLVRVLIGPPLPAEATALVALMLLQDARRNARLDPGGRSGGTRRAGSGRWDQGQIAEALPLVPRLFGAGPVNLRCRRRSRRCIVRPSGRKIRTGRRFYVFMILLRALQPSPIVSLNRAVAVAMVDGPRPALAIVDSLAATGDLESYHLLHAARADLLRRAGIARGGGQELYAGAFAGYE